MFRSTWRLCVALAAVLTAEWVVVAPAAFQGNVEPVVAQPALVVVRAELNYPDLSEGATGEFVIKAQQLLNAQAKNICSRRKSCLQAYTLKVDGIFGPRTKRTVKAFQAQQDLTIDGIVGINTWAELVDPTPSCDVLRSAWMKYSGAPQHVEKAVVVAFRESGCRLQAVNQNSRTRDNSHGPWQINYFGKLKSRERSIAPIHANHESWESAIKVAMVFVTKYNGFCHWRTARC
jgi:hypothetical protein